MATINAKDYFANKPRAALHLGLAGNLCSHFPVRYRQVFDRTVYVVMKMNTHKKKHRKAWLTVVQCGFNIDKQLVGR